MSSINDSLSVLNVEQLNNAVSLAHVLPLQPDPNQTNQLALPVQSTSHALSLPRITASTAIPTNNINSTQLPILMQLNTVPQGDHILGQSTNAIRQITIPVLQEQVLLPMQNVTPTQLGTCTLQPNTLTGVEHNTDISLQALLSSPNQLNTLNLNQVIDQRPNDNARQNNNLQVITSLPVTMTTTQPIITNVNQSTESSKLTHDGRTYLINFKLPLAIQNNQPVKINSTPAGQPDTDITNATIGQQLQLSLSSMQNPPTHRNGLNVVTHGSESTDTDQQMLQVQDPVAAASLFAGVTDDLEESPAMSSPDSPKSSNFNTCLWCVECNRSHPSQCPHRGKLHYIKDSPIVSHARQTLPVVLQIKSSTVIANIDGVFARETIAARSQFGPLNGIIKKETDISNDLDCPTHWKIYQDNDVDHCVDASDENVCNWMMLVRIARVSVEQNLVAYQWGQYIFFTTTRAIQPGEELLYWYSEEYALKKGLKDKPENCFWCTKCNRQFISAMKLSRHMKYSHPDMTDRKFKCPHCSRAFLCLTKLNVHKMTHSNMKPHKCNICEKTFTDPSNLRMHSLIHSGVKKFKCPQCDRGFRQKAHLVTHMVTHTGEKKLKCPQCDKLFSRQSDVKTHMYFHTKEKQAKCPLCFKEFWNPQHYRRHMKSHAREREYRCTFCKRGFNTLTHCKRHEESGTCQRLNMALTAEKSQESLNKHVKSRQIGRPKTRIRTDINTTPRLIAPATNNTTPRLVAPAVDAVSQQLPELMQDFGKTQVSAITVDIGQPENSPTWRKRSTRISERRKQGKVMNYARDESRESPDF